SQSRLHARPCHQLALARQRISAPPPTEPEYRHGGTGNSCCRRVSMFCAIQSVPCFLCVLDSAVLSCISDLDERLAKVPSLQHSNESAGCCVEAFHDVLAITNSAVCYQRFDFPKELAIVLGSEFGIEETPEHQTAPKDRERGLWPHVVPHLLNAVIERNQATHGHACIPVEERQHCRPYRAAGVFEIDIDPIGANVPQDSREILCMPINGG